MPRRAEPSVGANHTPPFAETNAENSPCFDDTCMIVSVAVKIHSLSLYPAIQFARLVFGALGKAILKTEAGRIDVLDSKSAEIRSGSRALYLS